MQILKELDGHPNIVCLKGAFFTDEGGSRLNLVLEFLSDTLHRAGAWKRSRDRVGLR